jgi:hypothetical protein
MRRPDSARTVAAMDDNHRTDGDRALRVQLELRLDRRPIVGRLRPQQGAEEHFVGWLGFAESLKRLHDAAIAEGEERLTR